MVSLLVRRREKAVNLRGLRGIKERVDKVNKVKIEEKVEEKVEEEALLPYQGVKYNVLCILYR